jgi:hypothetical protein
VWEGKNGETKRTPWPAQEETDKFANVLRD